MDTYNLIWQIIDQALCKAPYLCRFREPDRIGK